MHIADTIENVRSLISSWKKEGLRIGLTPTMGYLHEGHQRLIEQAAKENDRVVVSIFVNPKQFGPNEDLDRYPRDAERDAALCRSAGAHLIFRPAPSVMYPEPFQTTVSVSNLTEGLCGRSRPGHFDGVCTVVAKLFNICQADRAYFGQKDAQQLAVIRQMVRDLNIPTHIVACPIVREQDGLAKSSRNAYLNQDERGEALALSRALLLAEQAVAEGEHSSEAVIALVANELRTSPLITPDYIEIVDPESLRPLQTITAPALLALAAFVGKTRLIDNVILKRSEER